MGYRVLNFDLTVARDREVIPVSRNNSVTEVQVLSLPNGAAVQVHIGEGRDGIPLSPTVVAYDICPGEPTGIFLTNVVQGGTLTLRLDFGDTATVQVNQ